MMHSFLSRICPVIFVFLVCFPTGAIQRAWSNDMTLKVVHNIRTPGQIGYASWVGDDSSLLISQPLEGGFRKIDLDGGDVGPLFGRVGLNPFSYNPERRIIAIPQGDGVRLLPLEDVHSELRGQRIQGCPIASDVRPAFSYDNTKVWIGCSHLAVKPGSTAELTVAVSLRLSDLQLADEIKLPLTQIDRYASTRRVAVNSVGNEIFIVGQVQYLSLSPRTLSSEIFVLNYQPNSSATKPYVAQVSRIALPRDQDAARIAIGAGGKLAFWGTLPSGGHFARLHIPSIQGEFILEGVDPLKVGLRNFEFTKSGKAVVGSYAARAEDNRLYGFVFVWSAQNGRLVQKIEMGPVYSVLLSPGGAHLAAVSESRIVVFRLDHTYQ